MSEYNENANGQQPKTTRKRGVDNITCRRYIYRKNRLKLDLNPLPKYNDPPSLSKSRSTSFIGQTHRNENGILGDYHYDSGDFAQLEDCNESQGQSLKYQSSSSLLTGWTPAKWSRAMQFYASLPNTLTMVQTKSLAAQLQLSELQIVQAWQSYQRQTEIRSLEAETFRAKRQKDQKNQYLRQKLSEMVSKDGTLTLAEMRNILMEQIRKDKRFENSPNISESKINLLLRSAGYSRRKFAPNAYEKNSKQNMVRRQEFCRYLKVLRAHNLPIYFYHQTALGKYCYRNQGWAKEGQRVQTKGFIDKKVMLRCLLSPQGIASWQLTYDSTNKRQLQSLIDKLCQLDPGYKKTTRKFLMVDKRAICNRDEFCQTVQSNEFDIISMPVSSILLNPIDRWFKRINNELRCEYYNSREDLMKKSECLLLRFNKKCLNWYLQYFPQEIENCLPLP